MKNKMLLALIIISGLIIVSCGDDSASTAGPTSTVTITGSGS